MPIYIPYSKRVPQGSQAVPPPSGSGRVWRGVADMGAAIAALGADWQKRLEREKDERDGQKLSDTKVATHVAMATWMRDRLNDPELTNEDFEWGAGQYGIAHDQTVQKAMEQLPESVRDEFMSYSDQMREKNLYAYTTNLQAVERGYRQDQSRQQILSLCHTHDEEGLKEAIAHNLKWWPKDEQAEFLDWAKSEFLYKLAEKDPDMALASLTPDMFSTAGLADRVRKVIADAEDAQEKEAERERKQAVLDAGRQAYADMVTYRTSGGEQGQMHSIVDLAQLYAAGGIGKEAYDACMSVWEDKAKPGISKRRQAYDRISTALDHYRRGDISEDEYEKIRLRESPYLDDTDAKYFIRQRGDVYDKAVADLRRTAIADATKILAQAPPDNTYEPFPVEQQIAMRGEVGRRMDVWVERNFTKDKPIDRAAYEREVRATILEVRETWDAEPEEEAPAEPKTDAETIPTGFEKIWPRLSDKQKQTVRRYSDAERKAFLEELNKKPVPLGMDMNEVPTTSFMR